MRSWALPNLIAAVGVAMAVAGCAPVTQLQRAGSRSSQQPEELHIDGAHLITHSGRTITLRGVNLGGWLVTESWMCGFDDGIDDDVERGGTGTSGRSTQEHLEERFGVRKAVRLMRAWRSNWLTKRDLDLIQTWGFNAVRVPIGYRTVQDFSSMDWLVRESKKRGLYVIFDLHVWPDQALQYDRIGRPEGAAILTAMAALWRDIALHYKGEATIAAFDVINEFPGAWGVQKALAKAISDADASRLLVIEGYSLKEFQDLQAAGEFRNAIYSDHLYRDKPVTLSEVSDYLKQIESATSPVYIGEFQPEDFAGATSAMNTAGVSWSTWTYKTVDMGEWGIFNYFSNVKTSIQADSYASILQRWSKDLTQWQRSGAPNFYINEHRHPAETAAADLTAVETQSPR